MRERFVSFCRDEFRRNCLCDPSVDVVFSSDLRPDCRLRCARGCQFVTTCLTEHVELIRMLILVCCLRAVQICILTLYKSSIKTKSLSMLRRAVSRSETYDDDEISILYQDSSYFQEVGS